MICVRTRACSVTLSDKTINKTSAAGLNSQDHCTQSYKSVQQKFGNHCCHDKNNFKKPDFLQSKRRPHVLEEAKRRIDHALDFPFQFPEVASLFYHTSRTQAGIHRKIRSERREGTYSLAIVVLLQYLDLKKMACGHYDQKNDFHYIDYQFVKNKTAQSMIRVKREMQLLQEREIIRVTTNKRQNGDGTWKTTGVQIEFTDKIFSMLGLVDQFLKDRETSYIKFHTRQLTIEKKQKRLEIYRKKSFYDAISRKQQKILPVLTAPLKKTMKMPLPSNGNGHAIREKMQQLLSSGMSMQDAIAVVKRQYPPS